MESDIKGVNLKKFHLEKFVVLWAGKTFIHWKSAKTLKLFSRVAFIVYGI